MKFVLLSILIIFLSLLAGVLIVLLLRLKAKKLRWWGNTLVILGTTVVLSISSLLIYLSVYSRAESSVAPYLESDETTKVERIDGALYFDGPSQDNALIFYPGAKVDTNAYAPLAHELASSGVDVFLVDMPLHFPLLGIDKAEGILNKYHYPKTFIGGHSLGGNCASRYALSHPSEFSGLVLLASFPSAALPKDYVLCSVYGSDDGVLDIKEYESAKAYWPKRAQETIIPGGNHAQFGRYGAQSGDKEATIDAQTQERLTALAILASFAL